MLKTIIYRMMSVGLAALMLLTSIDYTVDMHFCQGDLKSYSLFGEAEMCYKGEKISHCTHQHQKSNTQLAKKSCCSSRIFHAKLIQNQVASDQSSVIKSVQKIMVLLVDFSQVGGLKILQEGSHLLGFYDPPLILRDFQKILQIFRL